MATGGVWAWLAWRMAAWRLTTLLLSRDDAPPTLSLEADTLAPALTLTPVTSSVTWRSRSAHWAQQMAPSRGTNVQPISDLQNTRAEQVLEEL